MIKIPELLSPAGNYEALLAALANGADAAYLGMGDFNARRGANNFSEQELKDACELAHLANKRIYLTLNTLILPDELTQALDTAYVAWQAGVDALIVQDLGLLDRLSREFAGFELHASTQMNSHNSASVLALHDMGASRVTLSRELALDQIADIAKTGVELEVFAHGALCVCYSGQCLLSSLAGARSANRGLCAQACRLPYKLIDTSTNRVIKTPGEHLLSPKDLATIDILPKLVQANVASIKIEGRMKSASYVAAVTKAYRQALDELSAEIGSTCTTSEVSATSTASAAPASANANKLDSLQETFSRGFTTAYLEGNRGNNIMSYTRPNNQGIQIGRVAKIDAGLVAITTNKKLVAGDVLEFRTKNGRTTHTLDHFYGKPNVQSQPLEHAPADTMLWIRVKSPVSLGDRVFRVRSAELLDETKSTYDNSMFKGNNGLVKIAVNVKAKIDEALSIQISVLCDSSNNICDNLQQTGVTVFGAKVEAAKKVALTLDAIKEHVGRIGGTAFSIASINVDMDENAALPFSELHKTRALALEELSLKLLEPYTTRKLTPKEKTASLAPAKKGKVEVYAIVASAAQAKAAMRAKVDGLYLQTLNFEAPPAQIDANTPQANARSTDWLLQLKAKKPVKWLMPAITKDAELDTWRDLLNKNPQVGASTGLVVNNLGQLKAFAGPDSIFNTDGLAVSKANHSIDAGPSLGIVNLASINLLHAAKVNQVWLSPELSANNIATISAQTPLPLALTVYGQQEVMVCEHCLLMAQGDCDENCMNCARRRAHRILQDRKGYRFALRTDDKGRSHLYNAMCLDLIPSMPELVTLGISTMVVDCSLLTTSDTQAAVERSVRARDLAVRGAGSLPKREGYTTGHFFRGVY